MVTHQLVESKGDFVGMRRAPRKNAFELEGVIHDGANFDQFGFDDFRISHKTFSMAHTEPHGHHQPRYRQS